MNRLKIIIVLVSICLHGQAQRVKTPHPQASSFVRFTENNQQWDKHIKYRAQLDGGALFVEQSGKLTFHLYDKDVYRSRHLGKIISSTLKYHAYSINFIGSNSLPQIESSHAYEDYDNYFIGSDQQRWAKQVHHYKSISVKGLYQGIDALYNGGSQSIKYNFIVHPDGNPSDVKLQYRYRKHQA